MSGPPTLRWGGVYLMPRLPHLVTRAPHGLRHKLACLWGRVGDSHARDRAIARART